MNTDDLVGRELAPDALLPIGGFLRSGERLGLRKETVDVMLDSGLVRTAYLEYDVFATYAVRPLTIKFDPIGLPVAAANDDFETVVFESLGANLTHVSSNVPWVQLGRQSLNEHETEITVAVRPRFLSAGLNEGLIFVETDDRQRPTQTVAVRVEARAALRAVPGRLFLRVGDERSVYLVNDEGDRVPVSQVTMSTGDTHVEHAVNPDGTVTVGCPHAGAESGATIALVAPDGRSVELRVYRMD